MKVKEAAKILGLSQQTIRKFFHQGILRGRKRKGKIHLKEMDVNRLLFESIPVGKTDFTLLSIEKTTPFLKESFDPKDHIISYYVTLSISCKECQYAVRVINSRLLKEETVFLFQHGIDLRGWIIYESLLQKYPNEMKAVRNVEWLWVRQNLKFKFPIHRNILLSEFQDNF